MGPMSAAAAAQRQKRMRTSFKHHQLRVMKSYFELNHNPDAKDLKQLSQKTGLSKRVLQVWFQNARAKYRRNQTNIDPDTPSTKTMATMQNCNTSPSSPHSIHTQHQTGNNCLIINQSTTELGLSMDDMTVLNHHQLYRHHNSTTDTSSLNDLDLICQDEDDDIDDQGDNDDDDDDDDENNNTNINDENLGNDDLNYDFNDAGDIRFNKNVKFKASDPLMQLHARGHHSRNDNGDDLLLH